MLLLEALDQSGLRDETSHYSLDRDRHSQLVFIDGDRGMGKTSVLLSLRDLIENSKFDDQLPLDGPVRRLHGERKKFILLETLDMGPLPRTANR